MKASRLNARADERLLKVHARWNELANAYLREYGALSMTVLAALFDKAEKETR